MEWFCDCTDCGFTDWYALGLCVTRIPSRTVGCSMETGRLGMCKSCNGLYSTAERLFNILSWKSKLGLCAFGISCDPDNSGSALSARLCARSTISKEAQKEEEELEKGG